MNAEKAVEPGSVGVRIGADFDAGTPRLVDMRNDFRHASPVLAAGCFEMPDLNRDMSLTANADGFVDGGNDGVAFAAHVRGVNSSELGTLRRQGDQFFGGGIRGGRVLQRGG